MCIVIDQGNSFTKIARFSGNEIAALKVTANDPVQELISQIQHIKLSAAGEDNLPAIFSTVLPESVDLMNFLMQQFSLLALSDKTKLPVVNLYNTPDTLGKDRIAAVVGARRFFPEIPVLTIDAGTCITYDFITDKNQYLGGGISPGIRMRIKALHTFTGKLPLVSLEEDAPLIGKTTNESILSGVLNGVIAEVDGLINRYRELYPLLKVILTGGDAIYFDKKLKSNIFAVPNLVLLGLKDILSYNVEN